MKYCAVLILLLFAAPALVLAAEAKKSVPVQQGHRYCVAEDVIGNIYNIAVVSESPEARNTQYFHAFPYQYIAFYANSYYGFLNSKRPVISQVKMNEAIAWTQKSPHSYRYVLGKKGDFVLLEDKKIKERYQCIAVLKNEGDYREGDLILTSYPAADSDSRLYKLYRRYVATIN